MLLPQHGTNVPIKLITAVTLIMTDLYFQNLSTALKQAHAHIPTLVIDKARLDHNLNQLMTSIGQGFSYRIVAKSLPSIPFLQYIMRRTGTNRLMSFHLPFLMKIAEEIPSADVLMGKPMPVEAARVFYQWYKANTNNLFFAPDIQLQWLVDTPDRVKQYADLAKELGVVMRLNLEIDIGLHRGGFQPNQDFSDTLKLINQTSNLQFAGIMGYEAHISRLPALLGGSQLALKAAQKRYHSFLDLIKKANGSASLDSLCLNTGGSSTYSLHEHEHIMANEIATASALVKPTDFDVFSLDYHQPAAFIATPVLKRVHKPNIPDAPLLSSVLRFLGKLPSEGCYIYGGNWLATPCSPVHAQKNAVLGNSSNQEFYELPNKCNLQPDDYMFFRPTQSEAVLLQFGDLAVYEDGKIKEWWPAFDIPKSYQALFTTQSTFQK